MRIIAGEFSGRILASAVEDGLRPAMGRTRESLFSIINSQGIIWSDCKALDLFAGCGSLAFESLSRGANMVYLVDSCSKAVECIKKNISSLHVEDRCRVFQQDTLRFLRLQSTPFDIVFIDPPYRRNLVAPTLSLLDQNGWLNENAFIVAEIEKNVKVNVPEKFELITTRRFGQTNLYIWVKS